jgi:hypothetical protein
VVLVWFEIGLVAGVPPFTKKTPFSPISATVSVLESSLLSIRAVFKAFRCV